jgi:leucyl aminopeptidase
MIIEFVDRKFAETPCDLLAYPLLEDEPESAPAVVALDKATGGVVRTVRSSGEFKAKLHSTCLIHNPRGLKASRLLLLGVGKKQELNLARWRDLAGTAARSAKSAACRTVAFAARSEARLEDLARVCAEGALMGNYDSDLYKTREKESRELERFLVLDLKGRALDGAQEGIRRGTIVGDAVNLARNLANEPANVLTPASFAEKCLAAGATAGLDVEVLERGEMEKLGMNTLLAVARGSEEPPKLIILRIKGQRRRKGAPLYALLGKGVTFDSGGISIKPAEKMEDMKADMAGAAAVLGAMVSLAQLRPSQQVIGLIPAVENLPSGKASKPGDVVKTLLGKTVEIINTDAEGRLILADAIAYARSIGATHLIDIATLTGACVVALGMVYAGMMGTDQKLIDRLRKNCGVTGEKLWQLPLDDDYRKAIQSEIADIKNVGNRWAGAITAGKFLQEFAEDTPWVHLDIAGVDLDHDGRPFAAKGATGFGVRTLTQLFL